jgi:hypothetical protein
MAVIDSQTECTNNTVPDSLGALLYFVLTRFVGEIRWQKKMHSNGKLLHFFFGSLQWYPKIVP